MALSQEFQNNITNISFSFLFGGIVLLLFTINNYSYNSIIGTMIGYTTITFAIFLLSIMSYANIGISSELSFFASVSHIISQMSPYILFLSVLIFSIGITNSYLYKLTNTEIPKSFKSFNMTSIVLIIAQTALLIYTIKSGKSSSSNDRIENSKLRLLGFINLIVLFTSFICIKYFTTDG